MPRQAPKRVSKVSEAFELLTIKDLQPLAKLVAGEPPTRKPDLVGELTRAMSQPGEVCRLDSELSALGKAAIREALANPDGRLDLARFEAKYGSKPSWEMFRSERAVQLFMPLDLTIPEDLCLIVGNFVPKPEKPTIPTLDELPEAVPEQLSSGGHDWGTKPELMPLRQRLTAPAAIREFPTVLHLVDSGKLAVSEKTRRPSLKSVELVEPLLVDGDFFQTEDRSQYKEQPGWDLATRAFAWPCIVQAAGLTSVSAGKLSLSPAGRKALDQPAQFGLRAAWKKWVGTQVCDEFERIDAIKGKQSARLSAVADRRSAVSEALKECPTSRWVAIDEFFRLLKASGRDFPVARDPWKLYITEQRYGYFAERGEVEWKMLQGRFIMAMLFEYAATLGLIDVAYVAPQWARADYCGHWGTDDYDCLSRYDGLKFFRINGLGAWCLDLVDDYQPEPIVLKKTWKALPNHDVVSTEHSPEPADALFLDRVADRISDQVWRLDRDKILRAIEDGLAIDTLREFLEERSSEPVPANVQTFLADLRSRATRLRDRGAAHMIECADAETALNLLSDTKLKTICLLAGDRTLVFPASQESAVRNQLRKLGYVIPPVGR